MLKKLFKDNAGFTLIEMLIVLLIISVLIILIVPNLSNSSKDINDKGCDALVAVVQSQVNLYYLENRAYPTDLDALVSNNYITSDQTKCSNDKAFTYNNSSGVVSNNTN